jgi:hypothetical protein
VKGSLQKARVYLFKKRLTWYAENITSHFGDQVFVLIT